MAPNSQGYRQHIETKQNYYRSRCREIDNDCIPALGIEDSLALRNVH